MKLLPFLLAMPLLAGHALGQRASGDYTVAAETFDVGGDLLASEDYSAVSSPGTSTITIDPDEDDGVVIKTGFASRVVDVTGLTLHIDPEIEVNEMTAVPIEGTVTNDDGTSESVVAADLDWQITGPITIQSNLAMVGAVYQDSVASLDGTYRGFNSSILIQIRDTDPDNFGLYAEDGVPDLWQVATFGENNPLGRGDADPFGSGQDVRFRYLAGLDPFDPNDVFRVHIDTTETVDIRFSPVRPGRLYAVESSPDLGPDWEPSVSLETADQDDERLLRIARDPALGSVFFRVRIDLAEE